MINETEKTHLMSSLIETIDTWLDTHAEEIDGYHGFELSRTMATAAMAVLEANGNMEEYLRSEFGLKE